MRTNLEQFLDDFLSAAEDRSWLESRKSYVQRMTVLLEKFLEEDKIRDEISKLERPANVSLKWQDSDYDRMNPDIQELMKILRHYGNIDYGTKAYPLSSAEARAIINHIEEIW